MLDPVLAVPTANIEWFSNGVWQKMPHRHFFVNNLRQHFFKSQKHMPQANKNVWTELYKKYLLNKQIIKLNNITFRVIENGHHVEAA